MTDTKRSFSPSEICLNYIRNHDNNKCKYITLRNSACKRCQEWLHLEAFKSTINWLLIFTNYVTVCSRTPLLYAHLHRRFCQQYVEFEMRTVGYWTGYTLPCMWSVHKPNKGNCQLVLMRPLTTDISEILIKKYIFWFKKMHLKMPSGHDGYLIECIAAYFMCFIRTHNLQFACSVVV